MPSYGPLPSELSVSIAVSVPSFTSNSSISTPTLASVSSPSIPSPAVLSPSLPCTFSTVQPYSPYSPSDTLQTSSLPLRSPSVPEQAAYVYVPPPTLVSGIPVQGSVSYTLPPLIKLCISVAATSATAFLSLSASLSCSASLSSPASRSSSASLANQSAQLSTVPMTTAAVSEPLVSPRTSVQTEPEFFSNLSRISVLIFNFSRHYNCYHQLVQYGQA